MIRHVEQTLRRQRLLKAGEHVLVGVSGGADSVALAYVLNHLKRRYRWRLTLAHLNHRLRGRAADRDEAFVRQLGWRLGLPVICQRADVRRQARKTGLSLEMAARQARLDFFRRAARQVGADVVALGHTLDDHAETVLLRLARGTGPAGLAGIAHQSDWEGLRLVRPLRDLTHAQIVRFLRAHRLAWREDATNRDPRFLRNRVRHEILPLLERRLNPRAREALARAGDLLREENEWIENLARDLLRCCRARDPEALSCARLRRLPTAARRRVLRRWLLEQRVDASALDAAAIERVAALLEPGRPGRQVTLSGARVLRRYEELRLARGPARPQKSFRVKLKVPGTTKRPAWGWRIAVEPAPASRSRDAEPPWAEAWLDARRVGRAALFARSWRAGDRFAPRGLKGTRKIQDIFVDAKIPREERHRLPLLECRGQIVWVPGYRVARGWNADSSSPRALHVALWL